MSRENLKQSNNKLVMGVDILPGKSSLSTRQPHYAVVFLKNGKIVNEYEDVSLSRLIRLVWEHRPSIIAIDNIFELAPDEKKLLKLMSLLPSDIELIQVTGWGPQAVNIKAVARNLGLSIHGKLSPLKTAYVSAYAASKGYGYRIKFLEEKTKIIVSKGRSLSRGGMSYNRYIRSIRAGILRMTREIKSILDKNKLDYDLVFKKSEGGLERSMFIVYAPRTKLYGLIKPVNTKTVRVEIKPIYTSRITAVAGSGIGGKSLKPIIVGLDPGMCTGIAIIDLNGTPLFLHSSKNIDRSDIINMICSIGNPVLIATDVASPPEAVKKLAATLHVSVYTPSHDLSNDEKNLLIYSIKKIFPWIEIDDTHERDALAAAYKAYLSYQDKFRQLESELNRIDIPVDPEKIKAAIIKGKTLAEALESEVDKLIEKELHEAKDVRETKQEKTDIYEQLRVDEEVIARLQKRIKHLEAEKLKLQHRITDLISRMEELETELRVIKHSHKPDQETKRFIELIVNENKNLQEEIKKLRNEIERLAKEKYELINIINSIIDKDMRYIPVVLSLTTMAIKNLLFTEKSVKAIFVESLSTYNAETIDYLFENRIAIVSRSIDGCLDGKVPIISLSNYEYYIIGDRVYVDKSIEEAIAQKWREIEKKLEEDEFTRVIKLIEDYRRERKKKLGIDISGALKRTSSTNTE